MSADGAAGTSGRKVPAPVVGVMGGGSVGSVVTELAEQLGERIARCGWTLLNGGRDAGVMAASARGAARGGGLVVGVLPGSDRTGSSPDLTVVVVTGIGDARNAINVLSSDVVVALPGGAGTLSEISLARKARRPLVLLGWPEGTLAEFSGDAVVRVDDAANAIEAIRHFLESG
jgi:uncharacterized protein (TIGR00725 family)